MFKQLACAITGLTQELALTREERKRELATKQDLKDAEHRIIAAVQRDKDGQVKEQIEILKDSGESLEKAVEQNQP